MLNQLPRALSRDFTLDNCLFGGVKLTKNADPGKYVFFGADYFLIIFSLFLELI